MDEHLAINDQEQLHRTSKTLRIQQKTLAIDYAEDRTALSLIDETSQPLIRFLSTSRRYRIDPIEARQPVKLSGGSELNDNATNLSSVLGFLEKEPLDKEQILELIQLLVPAMEQIRSVKGKLDSKYHLTFKEQGTRTHFPARLISDGTIYALSLLAILYGHHYGLIMIEEPERGLHPKAIEELTQLFLNKSSQAQPVYFNTHSESVVRATPHDNLYLVNKVEGITRIVRATHQFPGYDYSTMRLDTMWLSNLFDGGLPW
jgi:predicted ATPase